MKKILSILILLFSIQLTNAQFIGNTKSEAAYIITEEGEKIYIKPGGLAASVQKGDTKLKIRAFVKRKGEEKARVTKFANFQKAIDGRHEAKIIKIEGKRPKVYIVRGESKNHMMLSTIWYGKYNNHTYYYLISKKGNKLIEKGEFGHGKRKRYHDQEKSYRRLLKKYNINSVDKLRDVKVYYMNYYPFIYTSYDHSPML